MKNNLLILLLIISFVSCNANENNIAGKWQVVDVFPVELIISANMMGDWKEFVSACSKEVVYIYLTGNKMVLTDSNKCDQEGDFRKCDTIAITPMVFEVKADKDTLEKYPDVEIYSDTGYVNQTFLNVVMETHKVDVLKGYNTNCSISWGEETFKIISVTNNRLVFYVYSYMLILERA